MKAVKILSAIVVILAVIGLGIYHFGTKIASDKLVYAVSHQLESSGEGKEIKKAIEIDPELKKFVEGGKNVDRDTLAFTTKEEATKTLISKFGVGNLKDIQTRVQNGSITKEELMAEAESKLTEEEIFALKVIAYKELNKE
ncbi:hypothetical protein [Peribacillus glennii]|uniref:Phenylalanyl-tRNA synthetase subunit beta n=1 Tax=Peribacillus glennii TaxID=2303991 RepID=A0A372L7H6_9BACI|nr:hypothetical protein [Peribacillus glennii]RFU61226.1 hypothetical protein D0466_18595 [Peribacillus glennii]